MANCGRAQATATLRGDMGQADLGGRQLCPAAVSVDSALYEVALNVGI